MNLSELTTLIEGTYSCFSGPPRAYFELPLDIWPVKGSLLFNDRPSTLRITYSTISRAVRGSGEEAEQLLTYWVATKLLERLTKEQREDRCVCLIWRKKPVLIEFIGPNGESCMEIALRLAIPGIDLSTLAVPEGVAPPWL